MIIVKNMSLKCWDCFDSLHPQEMWYWRPAGNKGNVCHECAKNYLRRGTIMIRQYNWNYCGFCSRPDPDHYATCDDDLPIPTGHGFHLQCFTETKFEKKFKDIIQVGVARVLELEETEDDNNGDLNVYGLEDDYGWGHNDFTYSVDDVLDVKCALCSSSTFCKKVLVSWRLSIDEKNLPVTFRCWESYAVLDPECLGGEMRKKADKMFEERLRAMTVID